MTSRTTQSPSVFNHYEEPSSSSSSSDGEEQAQTPTPTPPPRLKQARLSSPQPKQLSLLTFNVLADHLCRPSWFPYRTKDELEWKHRRESLKLCIAKHNASLVCLQEVQSFVGPAHLSNAQNHNVWFDDFLRNELGYAGLYGTRMTAAGKESTGVQIGNMVYFKRDEFEPLEMKRNVALLKTVHTACGEDKDARKIYCHSGARGTVATFAALQCKTSARRVLVVTTHLPAPRSDTDYQSTLEQLTHAIALLYEIAHFCEKVVSVDCILFAGDLNAMPSSGVCELLRTGRVPARKLKRILRLAQQFKFPERFVMAKEKGGGVRIPDVRLRAPPTTSSAAQDNNSTSSFFENAVLLNGQGGVRFTNRTNIFTGWLDHVHCLAAPGVLDLKQVKCEDASLVSQDLLLPCPGEGYGSDHLPLLCEFVLSPYEQAEDGGEAADGVWIKSPVEDAEEEGVEDEVDFPHVEGDEAAFKTVFLDGAAPPTVVLYKLGGDLKRGAMLHSFIAMKPWTLASASASECASSPTWVFDLNQDAITALVKQVMEDGAITKVTYDCRQDADVLFHLPSPSAVTVRNVLDLQVYAQAGEYARNAAYALEEATQSWFPFLPSLDKTKSRYLDQTEVERLKLARPHAQWRQQLCPFTLEYMSGQLAAYEALLRVLSSGGPALPSQVAERLDVACRSNVRRFRHRPAQVDFVREKRMVMEELSIMKGALPGEEDVDKESYCVQWVAAGLVKILEG